MKIMDSNISSMINYSWLFIVATLTLGMMVPLDMAIAQLLTPYAMAAMLLFLVIGLIGLVFRNNFMILTNFLACIALCVQLKETTNATPLEGLNIKVAHLVLEDEESITGFAKSFKNLDVNFLSIQTPIDPTLEQQLTDEMSKDFPFWDKSTHNDDLTLFVFSEYALKNLDTLYCRENKTVSLIGTMSIDEMHQGISFLSTQLPFGKNRTGTAHKQLASLNNYIENNCQNKPFLALGGKQLVSWKQEIQDFKEEHRLSDSNESKTANEHIFYSKNLICVDFVEIFDGKGVVGTYQVRGEGKKNQFSTKTRKVVPGSSAL